MLLQLENKLDSYSCFLVVLPVNIRKLCLGCDNQSCGAQLSFCSTCSPELPLRVDVGLEVGNLLAPGSLSYPLSKVLLWVVDTPRKNQLSFGWETQLIVTITTKVISFTDVFLSCESKARKFTMSRQYNEQNLITQHLYECFFGVAFVVGQGLSRVVLAFTPVN